MYVGIEQTKSFIKSVAPFSPWKAHKTRPPALPTDKYTDDINPDILCCTTRWDVHKLHYSTLCFKLNFIA